MIKLYKRIKRALHYHEAWTDGAKIIEHWGKVGTRGKTIQHKKNRKLKEATNLEQVLAEPLANGFESIDLDAHSVLLIEYPVSGMGNTKDLDKRHALEDRMNETLGWTGLGHCDGGSIGSGSMEVCCYVVDFPIAKRVIEADLRKTKFADYSRIYDERVEPPPVLIKPSAGESQQAPQGRSVPLGDVDAQLLHQPGRSNAVETAAGPSRGGQERAASPLRKGGAEERFEAIGALTSSTTSGPVRISPGNLIFAVRDFPVC